ncbi:hypothetical protein [Haloarcula montana]|uniref:hypothetical protein n=1 Tax=Haloarcula montana TaxID=3111776 RepID=UPI002D7758C3|nr:hypothetical protein [Haloarcula sp. GH36]
MPNLTRDSRQERIERDNGDPDDIVRVRSTRTSGTPIYHTNDEECRHVDERAVETDEVTRGWCWNRNYPPCMRCILDDVDETGPTGSPAIAMADDQFEPDYEFEWDQDEGGEA